MNNIGSRIKELRRKNDMTQEKLADFLGVTHKAVSKWECGTTIPDLALIVPLARVLGVTTDELLGMKPAETDERRKYFDAECIEYWKKDDHEADYKIAKQAVEEYPGEYRYLNWLGTVEYYISFDRPAQEDFIAMMDSSIKHNLIVYENCTDDKLKYLSLWNIICAYRYSGRTEEAKKYAMLYPENDGTSRDDALSMCLDGNEGVLHNKKMISDALRKLCGRLGNIWSFGDISDPTVYACMIAEKTIIETMIPDGNTLEFSIFLSGIHEKSAEAALRAGDYDKAVRQLEEAKRYAEEKDRAGNGGKHKYTCPILRDYEYEYTDKRRFSEVKYFIERLTENRKYDILRNRSDFKKLLDEPISD